MCGTWNMSVYVRVGLSGREYGVCTCGGDGNYGCIINSCVHVVCVYTEHKCICLCSEYVCVSVHVCTHTSTREGAGSGRTSRRDQH